MKAHVTLFETLVAGTTGLFTGGPIGAVAAGIAINGFQGKWIPWFVFGIPATIAVNVVNIGLVGVMNTEVPYSPAVTSPEYVIRSK